MTGRLLVDTSPLRESRSFRYLFIARVVSILGIGFLIVAVPVHVYDLTGATGHVAAVATTLALSGFAGTVAGGLLADRVDRRSVIAVARAIAGICFALLALNASLDAPLLWAVYVLAGVDGLCGGISSTALMAVTPSLVERRQLPAAGALIGITGELGAVVGPALGGVVIAAVSVVGNFALAAAATAATTWCITRLPSLPPPPGDEAETATQAVRRGLRFAGTDRVVGGTLLLAFVSILLGGWVVLIPQYATEVLDVGESLTGVLYAAPAVGALAASLLSGWTTTLRWVGRAVYVAMLVSIAGLAAAGATATFAVALLGLVVHGAGEAIADVVRYATVQRHTPDAMRGRVASAWGAQITVGSSVGAMVGGAVASLVDVRWTFLLYAAAGAAVVVACAVVMPTYRALTEEPEPAPA